MQTDIKQLDIRPVAPREKHSVIFKTFDALAAGEVFQLDKNYGGLMKPDEDEVIKRLKTVIDPELGINIVDLGLIYSMELEDTGITVTMTLTTPGCPMHNSMPGWVKKSLSDISPDLKVDVKLVWQPPWTPDIMSDEAKRQLGRC